ncbi:lupus La protein [Mytilus galloprovincialis]|uniref:Lupus La protein n=1 Tax=Mytilus galloprovincialis TaxID=29158 RepID=A0A8B6EVP9_MYTGA|nr:lupus La protein [Mytilus galloprovincialis]
MADILTVSALNERKAYVSNFPLEFCQSEVEEYFYRFFGDEVISVYLKTDFVHQFQGAVYVEFRSKDSMEKFVNSSDILIIGDYMLDKMTKLDYYEKNKERTKGNKERRIRKREEDNARKKEEKRQDIIRQMTHGAVLHLTNIRTCIHGNRNNYSDDIDETELGYKHIKEYFSDFGRVAHVDYNPGDTQAYMRFEEEGTALEVFKQIGADKGNVLFNNCLVDMDVLQGCSKYKTTLSN